jgi:hypothetical protein
LALRASILASAATCLRAPLAVAGIALNAHVFLGPESSADSIDLQFT